MSNTFHVRRHPLKSKAPTTIPTVERAAVIVRDRVCFLTRLGPHECRDRWGMPHAPDDYAKMTCDHVSRWPGGMKGKRPEHKREWLVLMCWGANVGVPSKAIRNAERSYLRELYPEAWAA